MERWNELIAGYVLDNLTDEEHAELSEVLAKNPQLRLEIVRLRKTATLRCTQSLDWSLAHLEAGGEGWADSPDDCFPDFVAGESVSPVSEAIMAAAAESQCVKSDLPFSSSLGPFSYFSLSVRRKFKRQSFVLWMMALLLLGIAVDNCQTRRMLAIAQERILQLELSGEYVSDELTVPSGTD
ncbi:MAG: hypothetical protein WA984_14285 [Phormidesmis sp.]